MRHGKGYTGVIEYTEDDIRIAKDIYKNMCTDFNPRTIRKRLVYLCVQQSFIMI